MFPDQAKKDFSVDVLTERGWLQRKTQVWRHTSLRSDIGKV